MKSRFRLGVVLGVFAVMTGVIASAQDKKPAAKHDDHKATEKQAAGQPSPEEMQKWMEAATPGEAHAKLKPMTGKWTYVTKWRMSPEQPWEESTGKAEFKWILGDRVLVQEIKNNPGPQDAMMGGPFQGYGLTGYDNISKKYWNTWNDNMGTGIMTSEGTADGSGKVFTYASEFNCPMRGPNQKAKSVMKIEGDDKMVYLMFDKDDNGKEFQNLEVSYTRTK